MTLNIVIVYEPLLKLFTFLHYYLKYFYVTGVELFPSLKCVYVGHKGERSLLFLILFFGSVCFYDLDSVGEY